MRGGVLCAILSAALVVACAPLARAAGKAEEGEKSKLKKTFEKLDADDDGKLTAAEFARLHGEIKPGKDEPVTEAELERFIADLAKKDSKINLFKGGIDLTIYTIVVFLILFTVLRAFAWKPIAAGLDKREQTIAHDKAEADRARLEAGKMRDELASERARVNDEVRRMMDKARTDAEALAAEREAQGKAALAAERDRLYRELDVTEDQVRKEVFDQGAQLATLISSKVIKKQLTVEDHRALIDEALKEFHAAASARKSDLENASA